MITVDEVIRKFIKLDDTWYGLGNLGTYIKSTNLVDWDAVMFTDPSDYTRMDYIGGNSQEHILLSNYQDIYHTTDGGLTYSNISMEFGQLQFVYRNINDVWVGLVGLGYSQTVPATSGDAILWTPQDGYAFELGWRDDLASTFNAGKLLISWAGHTFKSDDWSSWEHLGATTMPYAQFVNNKWIAFANNYIVTSQDGITIDTTSSTVFPVTDNRAVFFVNGQYVAVLGVAAYYQVYTSIDAITWSPAGPLNNIYAGGQSINNREPVFSLHYVTSADRYIMGLSVYAGGQWRKYLYHSSDLTSWTTNSTSTSRLLFNGTTLVNNLGGAGLFTSTDGITWASQGVVTDHMYFLATYTGTHFVLLHGSPTTVKISQSIDGITWVTSREMATPTPNMLSGFTLLSGNGSNIYFSYKQQLIKSTDLGVTLSTDPTTQIQPSAELTNAYGSGVWISKNGYTVDDGKTWLPFIVGQESYVSAEYNRSTITFDGRYFVMSILQPTDPATHYLTVFDTTNNAITKHQTQQYLSTTINNLIDNTFVCSNMSLSPVPLASNALDWKAFSLTTPNGGTSWDYLVPFNVDFKVSKVRSANTLVALFNTFGEAVTMSSADLNNPGAKFMPSHQVDWVGLTRFYASVGTRVMFSEDLVTWDYNALIELSNDEWILHVDDDIVIGAIYNGDNTSSLRTILPDGTRVPFSTGDIGDDSSLTDINEFVWKKFKNWYVAVPTSMYAYEGYTLFYTTDFLTFGATTVELNYDTLDTHIIATSTGLYFVPSYYKNSSFTLAYTTDMVNISNTNTASTNPFEYKYIDAVAYNVSNGKFVIGGGNTTFVTTDFESFTQINPAALTTIATTGANTIGADIRGLVGHVGADNIMHPIELQEGIPSITDIVIDENSSILTHLHDYNLGQAVVILTKPNPNSGGGA